MGHIYLPTSGYQITSPSLWISMYTPQILSERPAIKTIKVCSEEATLMPQDCFDNMDWELLAGESNLEDYSSSVWG